MVLGPQTAQMMCL
ncbi:unnamed protein product [Gulo gulo]|uniref:Uncharacterized protein n=1 Tax=Gulo gulo TaxID=48420 RepID=A0A9X9PX27_GULGU|nr:unnamed protein product [Gulo gulo]